MFRGALRLSLAAALCAAPALARADVYRWIDETGATRYATSRDEVPSAYRDGAELIKSVPTGVPNPSSARPPAPPRPPAPTAVEPPPPAQPAPPTAPPAPAPAGEPDSSAPAPEPTLVPANAGLPAERAPLAPDDPRQHEIAQLEAAIERDREELRQLISTPRWDAAELASDPHVREIAERLPRLQAELSALRSEAER